MIYLGYTAVGLAVLCEIILLFTAFLSGKPFRILFLNALSGIAVLALINIIGKFCDVSIAINEWTVGGSAAFGLPAVIGLLLLRLFVL